MNTLELRMKVTLGGQVILLVLPHLQPGIRMVDPNDQASIMPFVA